MRETEKERRPEASWPTFTQVERQWKFLFLYNAHSTFFYSFLFETSFTWGKRGQITIAPLRLFQKSFPLSSNRL